MKNYVVANDMMKKEVLNYKKRKIRVKCPENFETASDSSNHHEGIHKGIGSKFLFICSGHGE